MHEVILRAWTRAIEYQVGLTAGKPGKGPGYIQFQLACLLEAEVSGEKKVMQIMLKRPFTTHYHRARPQEQRSSADETLL